MTFSPDINILVQTRFMQQESVPAQLRFVFAYTINITNNGAEPVKLLTRYWNICDGHGKVQEVHGEGVVGQQPRLLPGESFEYTSGAVLATPAGTMQGHYDFVTDNSQLFRVAIPGFTLANRAMLH